MWDKESNPIGKVDEPNPTRDNLSPYGKSNAGDIKTNTKTDFPNRIFFTLPVGNSSAWVYLSQNTNGVYRFGNLNPESGHLNIGEGNNSNAIAYVQPGRILDIAVKGDLKISKGSKHVVSGWYEYLGAACS